MTIEENFRRNIVLEKVKNDYVLILWGGSTKQLNSKFYFSEWKDKCDVLTIEEQIFQWLLYCASTLTFSFDALELTKYAIENWYNENNL